MKTSSPALSTLLLLIVPFAPPLNAQDEAGELESFFDAVEVKIVNVDVIAVDKQGNPVTDLEMEDFRVYEDGEPVEITNFHRAGEEAALLQARAGVEATDPAATEATPTGPPPLTMALFVDNTSLVPGSRRQMLKDLEEFLDSQLQDNDRIILLSYDGRLSVEQQPTDSVDDLLAAIGDISEAQASGALRTASYRNVLREITQDTSAGATGGFGLALDPTPAIAEASLQAIRLYAEESHTNTLRTLAAVREALGMLSALPGPKAMIYAGAGMTQNPSAGLIQAWESRFSGLAGDVGGSFVAIRELAEFDATDPVQDVARVANTHRITLYTLNPSDAIGGLTPVEIQGMDSAGRRTLTPQMQSVEISNRAAVMNLMAASTGGAASTGAMDALLDTVRRDFDSLYSLAYQPDDESRDKDHRKIEVEVLRPGVELRYRRHYRETTRDERLADRTRSALLLEGADNPLGVVLEFGTPEEGEGGFAMVPVMVRVPMSALTLLPQGEAHEGRMSLFIGVRDERGRLAPVSKQTLPLRIPNADLYNALSQVGGYTFTLKLRPMAHTVAVTVHDEVGQVESVAQGSLEAPDFG